MLGDGAPGLVVKRVRVGLNFLRVVVRVERSLDDFEVLHELQRDSVRAFLQHGRSAVANGEVNREDGLDAMADDLHFARVHRQNDADVSRPQTVTILAVIPARKGAPRLLLAPAPGKRRGFSFRGSLLLRGGRSTNARSEWNRRVPKEKSNRALHRDEPARPCQGEFHSRHIIDRPCQSTVRETVAALHWVPPVPQLVLLLLGPAPF